MPLNLLKQLPIALPTLVKSVTICLNIEALEYFIVTSVTYVSTQSLVIVGSVTVTGVCRNNEKCIQFMQKCKCMPHSN